jgi:hypothetical protein
MPFCPPPQSTQGADSRQARPPEDQLHSVTYTEEHFTILFDRNLSQILTNWKAKDVAKLPDQAI